MIMHLYLYPHLLTLCCVSSGLSPRDLILHFRHKVENYRLDNIYACCSHTCQLWFQMSVIIYLKFLPSKALILFKLILLEKKVRTNRPFLICSGSKLLKNAPECFDLYCFLFLKVLFYVSPVNRLVGALMTVLSLFPGQHHAIFVFMHLHG